MMVYGGCRSEKGGGGAGGGGVPVLCLLALTIAWTQIATSEPLNVAVGLEPSAYTQSSFYRPDRPAVNAANGDIAGDYSDSNCIHTAQGFYKSSGSVYVKDTKPWWQVDLGRPYPVYSLTVWGRTGQLHRLYPFLVTVDEMHCAFVQDFQRRRDVRVNCTSPVYGQVIRLTRMETGIWDYMLNMCEFQVFVCLEGYWGADCQRRCLNCSDEGCRMNDGHCIGGCQDGYYKASEGRCDKCSSRCFNGCDPDTGKCNGCPNGRYGDRCQKRCDQNCVRCDQDSGCRECRNNWSPPDCRGCDGGWYGQNCSTRCGRCQNNATCGSVAGGCRSCQHGWRMPLCQEALDSGEGSVTSPYIVVAILTSLLAVLVIVVVIMACRLHRGKRTKENQVNTRQRGGGAPGTGEVERQNRGPAHTLLPGDEEEEEGHYTEIGSVFPPAEQERVNDDENDEEDEEGERCYLELLAEPNDRYDEAGYVEPIALYVDCYSQKPQSLTDATATYLTPTTAAQVAAATATEATTATATGAEAARPTTPESSVASVAGGLDPYLNLPQDLVEKAHLTPKSPAWAAEEPTVFRGRSERKGKLGSNYSSKALPEGAAPCIPDNEDPENTVADPGWREDDVVTFFDVASIFSSRPLGVTEPPGAAGEEEEEMEEGIPLSVISGSGSTTYDIPAVYRNLDESAVYSPLQTTVYEKCR